MPCVLLACGAALGFAARVPDDRIAPGVTVANVALGGMTVAEARSALSGWAQSSRTVRVRLHPPGIFHVNRVWMTTSGELGLGVDIEETLASARKAGREGIVGQVSAWVTGAKPIVVPPASHVESSVLQRYLRRIAHRVDRPGANARLFPMGGNKFAIRPERPGVRLDMAASAQTVILAWQQRLTGQSSDTGSSPPATPGSASAGGAPGAGPGSSGASAAGASQSPGAQTSQPTQAPVAAPPVSGSPGAGQAGAAVPAPTQPLELTLKAQPSRPTVTAADLRRVDGLLGSFTTRFGGTGRNRGSNISLAASRIDGTVLAPGEIFSYNRTVGPRVESAGFRDAPVIIKGELVPGVGGGICQVSSTLYNAALLADLKIVHRAHHAFPVHYLPAGRDATVVDGAIDLRFQNDSDAPVCISAAARRGRLTFRIFGKTVPGRSVRIALANHSVQPPGTETVLDRTVKPGGRVIKDKGHAGHRVTVYRIVEINGLEASREVISRDRYRPFPRIVLVGPKPAKPGAGGPPGAEITAPGEPPADSADHKPQPHKPSSDSPEEDNTDQ
jgi:vancomycin resistance protein YoaR